MPYPEEFDSHGLLRGRLERIDGRAELFLAGFLDVLSTDRLEALIRELARTTPGPIVLDLGAVHFLSFAAGRCLEVIHIELERATRRLVLRGARGQTLRVLELCGLDGLDMA